MLKSDHRCQVFLWAKDTPKERLSCRDLFGKRVLLTAGYVDQHCNRNRQISLTLEGKDLLTLAVFQHVNVVLGKIVYVTILLVGDIEWNSHELSAQLENLFVLVASCLSGLLVLSGLFLSGSGRRFWLLRLRDAQ